MWCAKIKEETPSGKDQGNSPTHHSLISFLQVPLSALSLIHPRHIQRSLLHSDATLKLRLFFFLTTYQFHLLFPLKSFDCLLALPCSRLSARLLDLILANLLLAPRLFPFSLSSFWRAARNLRDIEPWLAHSTLTSSSVSRLQPPVFSSASSSPSQMAMRSHNKPKSPSVSWM